MVSELWSPFDSRLNGLSVQNMAQIVFNYIGGKPSFFNGTSFDYWKRKIKIYIGSINDKVWDVVENEFVITDPTNLTTMTRLTSNATLWHSMQYTMALIQRCLSKSKILRRQVRFR